MAKATAAAVAAARWQVPRAWVGETVVCLGGGPSLTPEDVTACRGRARVIAVNDAYRLAPWADVLYGCDVAWWTWHQGVPTFEGLKVSTTAKSAIWPGIHLLDLEGEDGLSENPTALRHGRNSGYQAINLAVLFGATRILLLGYDMQLGPEGQPHWFGHHPNRIVPPVALFREKFATLVEPLRALGVEVLNCSRQTALDVFPRCSLREALL